MGGNEKYRERVRNAKYFLRWEKKKEKSLFLLPDQLESQLVLTLAASKTEKKLFEEFHFQIVLLPLLSISPLTHLSIYHTVINFLNNSISQWLWPHHGWGSKSKEDEQKNAQWLYHALSGRICGNATPTWGKYLSSGLAKTTHTVCRGTEERQPECWNGLNWWGEVNSTRIDTKIKAGITVGQPYRMVLWFVTESIDLGPGWKDFGRLRREAHSLLSLILFLQLSSYTQPPAPPDLTGWHSLEPLIYWHCSLSLVADPISALIPGWILKDYLQKGCSQSVFCTCSY